MKSSSKGPKKSQPMKVPNPGGLRSRKDTILNIKNLPGRPILWRHRSLTLVCIAVMRRRVKA